MSIEIGSGLGDMDFFRIGSGLIRGNLNFLLVDVVSLMMNQNE